MALESMSKELKIDELLTVVLSYLVTLWLVLIKIVLSVEGAFLLDGTLQCESCTYSRDQGGFLKFL